MYYIYLDESDRKGEYFSNFYGGILIPSKYLREFERRMNAIRSTSMIGTEEIKWQKVTEHTYESYVRIVDELFQLMKEGKARIRIFFRHNRNKVEDRARGSEDEEYTKLYYQFIKHSFGFEEAPNGSGNTIRLFIDEMPIPPDKKIEFVDYLYKLIRPVNYPSSGMRIVKSGIAEVDSKAHLPLQVMDLVLGSICFKLNNKNKRKNPETGKRGRRTIFKEKLYKHIQKKICELTGRKFNIGESTGLIGMYAEKWYYPYMHWKFVSYNSTITNEFNKK